MIIELPEFNFEIPHPNKSIESLFDKVRDFLEKKSINKNEYALGDQPTSGLGELVIKRINHFWVVFTTERGTNFDISVFTNEFHAVNYLIYRLTGEMETIDWSTI